MKRKSASVNDKAKALLDLIAPAYVSESQIPTGYLCVEDVARLHNMSLPGAQNKMQSLRRKGVVDVVKVKMTNGKIKNFYGAK